MIARWLAFVLWWFMAAGVLAHAPLPRLLPASAGFANPFTNSTPLTNKFLYVGENMTVIGTNIFAWNALDQVTNIQYPSLVTNTILGKTEFVYDGIGRMRIKREYRVFGSQSTITNETRYVYTGYTLLQELNSNNLPVVSYTIGNGLLARTDANGSAYYHMDGNQNVTMLVDAKGLVKAKYLYDPYGRLIGKWGPLADANTRRFSSEMYHPQSGLYNYGFRFYDPNTQRWLNKDPIGFAGGRNQHAFVGNNPINEVDPDGLTNGPEDFGKFQYSIQVEAPTPLAVKLGLSSATSYGRRESFWTVDTGGSRAYISSGERNMRALVQSQGIVGIGASQWVGTEMGTTLGEFNNTAISFVLPLPGLTKLSSLKCAANRAPIFVDNNLLVNAFRGNANALAEIRAGMTYVTPNQFREFLNVNEVAARRGFLEVEGVQLFAGRQAGHIASSAAFQQTFGSVVGPLGRGDAALAAFARATGYEAVTMERALPNFIKLTLKDTTVPIRRIYP